MVERRCLKLSVVAGGVLLLAGLQPAVAQPLAGWGPFKFGQTIKDASKAAGPTARVYEQVVELDVEIEGSVYVAYAAALGPSGRVVTSVSLSPKAREQAVDLDTCNALFEPMVALVAKKYGKPKGPPVSSGDDPKVERNQEFKLRDGSTINVINAFKSNETFGGPCLAYIEFTPAKDPDAPKKMEF
jgi:hypothetical protein